MFWVKQKQMTYIQTIIDYQPLKANSKLENNTKNDWIMFISFFVKLIELVTLIFTTSYFFLIIWVLLCEFIEDFILNDNFASQIATGNEEKFAELYFFPYYGLCDKSLEEVTLDIFYFAFTSLTTVGFGDFHPISELE